MRFLKYSIIVLLVIVGAWLLFCATSPSTLEVTRSISMNATASTVFSNVECLDKWPAWSPWVEMDPDMETTYSEIPCGQGAWASWVGKKAGTGKQTIVHKEGNSYLKTELVINEREGNYSEWFFKEEGGVTTVKWSFLGSELPFVMRPVNILMEAVLTDTYENGLKNLKELAESEPMEPEYNIKEVDLPASKFMLISAKVNPNHVGAFYRETFGEIINYLKEQDVEIKGYPTGLIHSWEGDSIVNMSAAIPITVNVDGKGDIEFWSYDSTKALQVDYFGEYSKTWKAHEVLKEFMESNGLELNGPVREVYVRYPEIEPDSNKWYKKIIYPML